MKVKVGMRVSTDFGDGPVVAMSKDWCIVSADDAEIAVPWGEVIICASPDAVVSSIEEHELKD